MRKIAVLLEDRIARDMGSFDPGVRCEASRTGERASKVRVQGVLHRSAALLIWLFVGCTNHVRADSPLICETIGAFEAIENGKLLFQSEKDHSERSVEYVYKLKGNNQKDFLAHYRSSKTKEPDVYIIDLKMPDSREVTVEARSIMLNYPDHWVGGESNISITLLGKRDATRVTWMLREISGGEYYVSIGYQITRIASPTKCAGNK
jgi:hypothetical protein